jgi:hypothetical protein
VRGSRPARRPRREFLEQRQGGPVEALDQKLDRASADAVLILRRGAQIEPEQPAGRLPEQPPGFGDHLGFDQAAAHGARRFRVPFEDQHFVAHLPGRRAGRGCHGNESDLLPILKGGGRTAKYVLIVHSDQTIQSMQESHGFSVLPYRTMVPYYPLRLDFSMGFCRTIR